MAATPPAPEAAAAPKRRGSMFQSLRIRNYRFWFAGQVLSNIGSWMQRMAQDWLVLTLTGSTFAMGVTVALQFIPMLVLGLWGGVIVDRVRTRRLLAGTQTAMCVLAVVLAVLTLTHVVQTWHVFVLALLLGLVTVIDNPAQQTFVAELVGKDDLPNAVALNSSTSQAARLIGPAVAGLVIHAVGTGWAFAANAVSFLAVLAALALMRVGELHEGRKVAKAKGQLREGLHYVAAHPTLLWLMVLVGVGGTFAFNFPVLLASYTTDVLHDGANTLGLLNSMLGVGSLAGSLMAARWAKPWMALVLASGAAFGLLEMILGVLPVHLWLFIVVLIVTGVVAVVFNAVSNSTTQLSCEPEMRGRVMGLYMLVFLGGTPIGSPLIGWFAEAYGAKAAFLLCGGVTLAAAASITLVLSRIDRASVEPRVEVPA
ncbi:MFS transporter [Streptomyces sp. NBC_01304]|uniref:MFS transporter n=1 Tax=Streptomyces sp. NBC_01304 TaxID=2903818 RepID=UPI002E109A1D|nr:MFS transporter [Streptomyces sp. NBC_01304]